ncbi:MAG TPA: hypothetical protein VGO28_10740 [Acidimicrobiia bacterium]|jgi:hypothetical protein
MGYRGKVKEQERARALRAQNRTLADIAQILGVSKSSVSLWVRDVPFTPTLKLRGPHRRPHPAHEAKLRQIEELNREGRERIGTLSETELLVTGVALYSGEGSKTDGEVRFSNSDPAMVQLFCFWFRRFFDVDESRIRGRLYLHEGLDLDAAEAFWSALTNIPRGQFHKAYRAVPDPSIRRNKHEHGCFSVGYGCSRTHRAVMGLVRALLSSEALPG